MHPELDMSSHQLNKVHAICSLASYNGRCRALCLKSEAVLVVLAAV